MTKCGICGKRKRPLLYAVHNYSKGQLDYSSEVFACLSCLGIKEVET